MRTIATVLILLLPRFFFALNLGPMDIHSRLYQPLSANIAIQQPPSGNLQATIASPSLYEQHKLAYQSVLAQIDVGLVNDEQGRYHIHLKSTQPINDAYIDILLQLHSDSGNIIRAYTLLLDPPSYNDKTSMIAAPSKIHKRASQQVKRLPHAIPFAQIVDKSAKTESVSDKAAAAVAIAKPATKKVMSDSINSQLNPKRTAGLWWLFLGLLLLFPVFIFGQFCRRHVVNINNKEKLQSDVLTLDTQLTVVDSNTKINHQQQQIIDEVDMYINHGRLIQATQRLEKQCKMQPEQIIFWQKRLEIYAELDDRLAFENCSRQIPDNLLSDGTILREKIDSLHRLTWSNAGVRQNFLTSIDNSMINATLTSVFDSNQQEKQELAVDTDLLDNHDQYIAELESHHAMHYDNQGITVEETELPEIKNDQPKR